MQFIDPINHIPHIEDLLFEGLESIVDLGLILADLQNMFENKFSPYVNLKLKWDGNPSIFFGENPENNRFFVATKSILNKEPVLFYTEQDIENKYQDDPWKIELKETLKTCLKFLPEVCLSKFIYQADVLFTSKTLNETTLGAKIQPNTITYWIDKNSPIYEYVTKAELGICYHTQYSSDLKRNNKNFWLPSTDNVFCQTSDIVIPQSLMYNRKLEESYYDIPVLNFYDFHDDLGAYFIHHFNGDFKIKDLVKRYVNLRIKEDRCDLIDTLHFLTRTKENYRDIIASLKKSDSIKNKCEEFNIVETFIRNNFKQFDVLFDCWHRIREYKNMVLESLHTINTEIKPLLTETLQPTKHEGFVLTTHDSPQVKLVDRFEFSKNNFNNMKWKK